MYSNSKSALKKIIIIFLIITLTYYNLVLIGSNLVKGLFSYALDNNSLYNNEAYANEVYTNQVYSNEIDEIYDNEVVCEVNVESTDLHKTRMEENTEFNEKLNINLKNVSDILIEDVANTFYDNEEQETEIANIKYVKTLLNKETLKNLLGEQGTFKVLDKEGNVQAELSAEYINSLEEELNTTIEENNTEETETPVVISKPQKFTKMVEIENEQGEIVEEEQEEIRSHVTISEETVEITYELEVKEIIFNIENINPEFGKTAIIENEENVEEEIDFVIENTKSVFAVQDLDNLNYLKEDINYTFNKETNIVESEEEQTEEPHIQTIVKFKDTITKAELSVDSEEWTLGEENVVNYSITLNTSEEKSELFKNPIFVLELPSCVDEVLAENSQFTVENDGGVFTEKHVSVVALAGRKYIVVTLEGEQTEESISENGNTIITLSLALNIANEGETNQETKLYYQNGTVTSYESGAGFDADAVNISLVLATEDGETIVENGTLDNIEEVKDFYTVFHVNPEEGIIKEGEEFEYLLYLNNIGNTIIQSVTIKDQIPDELEYISAELYDYNAQKYDYTELNYSQIQYDENTREVTVNIDDFGTINRNEQEQSLIIGGYKLLRIKVKANSLEKNVYNKKINNEIEILQNGNSLEKNNIDVTVSNAFLDISINNISEELELNDIIQCELNIRNLGLIKSEEKMININFPQELSLLMLTEESEKDRTEKIYTMLNNEDEVSFSISGEDCIKITMTAVYKTAVEQNKDITITVIIDEQEFSWTTELLKVGRDTENTEINMQEISNVSENTIENNEDINGSNEDSNTIDGENNTQNTQQANNGEKELEKFDLSLTQSLKKITVTNLEGTTTYNYNDTKFAKIEIPSKYMNGSTVTFEYEITVKNEGTIEGYARKIADYMPKGLEFNSELNPNWYVGDDGNLYSVTLIDKLLKPGETAKLNIVLTKQMTNENTGTVTNIAEIYEATNSQNVEDINSIPGDKLEGQNDIAKVEVIVAVKTGEIIIYVILTIIVLSILIYGLCETKKITINKKGGQIK